MLSAVMVGLLLTACKRQQDVPEEEPLARVYDSYLYPSDLAGLVNQETSPEDSAAIVSEFVDNWVRHQLVLKVAATNMQREAAAIEKQARDYKESLLIYAYERQWLAENLDTIISMDSLQAYFTANREEFRLQSDIYRLSYAVMPADITGYDTLRNWFVKDIGKFRNEMELFCLNHCSNYVFESPVWLDNNSLFKMLPLDLYGNGRLRTTGVVEYADDNNRYIVKVQEYILQGNYAPFDYVQEDIRRIIINRNKIDLLKKNYNSMYSDAMQRNNAQLYK